MQMQDLPTDDELEAWDWRAALRADDRSIAWLARRTDRSESAVWKYANGALRPPIAWLREAWALVGRQVAA